MDEYIEGRLSESQNANEAEEYRKIGESMQAGFSAGLQESKKTAKLIADYYKGEIEAGRMTEDDVKLIFNIAYQLWGIGE